MHSHSYFMTLIVKYVVPSFSILGPNQTSIYINAMRKISTKPMFYFYTDDGSIIYETSDIKTTTILQAH